MADLTKKMSPDNPTKILAPHDINNLRTNISTSGSTAVLAATANGLRSTATVTAATAAATTSQIINNSLSNLLAASKGTILNTTNFINVIANNHHTNNNNNNNNTIITNNNIISTNAATATMSGTSKYVFLQQQSNGQYTTFEPTTQGSNGNGPSSVGNIVLLAAEPMDISNAQNTEQHIITTAGPTSSTTNGIIAAGTGGSSGGGIAGGGGGIGDNDEELRPLAWLNDRNLIKGIVTTNGSNILTAQNLKRHLASAGNANICIVNASNPHDLIEELPQHVINEEHVATSNHNEHLQAHSSVPTGATIVEPQLTTLSVSEFQQQFIASSKRFSNALDATTTVHVGPSGTTTVVEYKATNNNPNTPFLPTHPRQLPGNNIATNLTTNATTITATNLSNNANNSNGTTTFVPTSTTILAAGKHQSHQPHHIVLPTSLITTSSPLLTNNNNNNNNNNHNNTSTTIVVNSNGTTNTLYQGHKTAQTLQQTQQQQQHQPHAHQQMQQHQQQATPIQQNSSSSQAQHSNTQNTTNSSSNNSNANVNSSTGAGIISGGGGGVVAGVGPSSTTHHPHKKYLREKMNVIEHGNINVGSVNYNTASNSNSNSSNSSSINTAATTGSLTVIASPASSNNSLSSGAASSMSTTAIHGGNSSPVSKSSNFSNTISFNIASSKSNLSSSTSSNTVVVSSSSSSSSSALNGVTFVGTLPAANIVSSAAYAASSIPTAAYTIVSHNPNASPEPASTQNIKDFYTLSTANAQTPPNQNTFHQQHISAIRSPTSYSSYDNDSLKDFEIPQTAGGRLQTSTPQQQQMQIHQQQTTPKSSATTSLATTSYSTLNSSSSSVSSSTLTTPETQGGGGGNSSSASNTPQKQKHPNNVPYDPLVHTHNKPPYSFSSLIFMAIEGSNEKALPVKEIYAWIVQHFPYFKTAPTGWKNSVRHNLSLNKSFVKVEKAPHMGKGSLWRVEPQQRQNLIQALTRSPFYQNSAVDKMSFKANDVSPPSDYDCVDGVSPKITTNPSSLNLASAFTNVGNNANNGNSGPATACVSGGHINERFNPNLFPNLSKFVSENNILNDVADVPDDEIPSDYSTTNSNTTPILQSSNNNTKYNPSQQNNDNFNSSSNVNHTTISNVNGNSNNNPNNGNINNNTSGNNNSSPNNLLGAFTSYESMERLARDCGAESIDDVNAAAAMLALKHGPKVFTETFQNGSPVITSSPSEDHTYSAGGGGSSGGGNSTNCSITNTNNNSNENSGSSTPSNICGSNASSSSFLYNGKSNLNGSHQLQNNLPQTNGNLLDNQSNCASSDAAYESSEENHNVTSEELDDQARHREGVDALLYLSLSSVMDTSSSNTTTAATSGSQSSSNRSASSSPNKRRSSISVEEAHIKSYSNNDHINNNNNSIHNKMSLLSGLNYSTSSNNNIHNNHHVRPANTISSLLDEGYSTQSYYGSSHNNNNNNNLNNNNHNLSQLAHHHHNLHHHSGHFGGNSAMRKVKPSRSLRTKIKKKAPWMR